MKYLLPAYTGLGNTVQLTNVINEIIAKDDDAEIFFISDNKLGQLNFLNWINCSSVITKLVDNKISIFSLLWMNRQCFDYILLPGYGTPGAIKIMSYIVSSKSIIEHDTKSNDIRILIMRFLFCSLLRKNIKRVQLEKNINEIDQYKDLIKPIKGSMKVGAYPSLKDNVRLEKHFLKKVKFTDKYICIQVGAANRGKTPKTWPKNNYIDLINKLFLKYPKLVIVLIGDDVSLADDLAIEFGSKVINFVGKTSIPELMALISNSHLVICLDSAIMHLSNFLEKPLIGIFGPTEHKRTFPKGSNNHIVKLNLECMPCMDVLSDKEALEKCRFNNSCMKNLEAQIVLDKIMQEALV